MNRLPTKPLRKNKTRKILSVKQELFCKEYLIDHNATKAAERAGYSKRTARAQASELLKLPKIQKYIQKNMNKRLQSIEKTSKDVVEELAKIAFSDIRELFDEEGKLKNINDIKEETAKSISSIQIIRRQDMSTDEETFHVHKINLNDKIRALDCLAKHFNLYKGDREASRPQLNVYSTKVINNLEAKEVATILQGLND